MVITILEGYTICPSEAELDQFRRYGDVRYFDTCPQEKVIDAIGRSDAIFIDTQAITKTVIDSCPNLKFIGVMGTGTDGVDLDYAKARNIVVSNVPAYGAASVAQHAFALLLTITNNIPFHSDYAKHWHKGNPDDHPHWDHPNIDLMGKTVGVFGYAKIARCFIGYAKGFSMNILVNTDYPIEEDQSENLKFVDRNELLANSDIISLHKPLTAVTEKMIGREAIAKMKDGAIIINAGRGGLIDEPALQEALEIGKIHAAGLDVLAVEPPERVNPLVTLPNTVVTPHVAWASENSRKELIRVSLLNLKTWYEKIR